MAWVYTIPPWLLSIIVIAGMSALAAGGLVAVRYYIPQNTELSHNDVAGPIIGTIGTVLAVMLSFMVVTVWQEYDQAAATVQSEASAIADIYHLGSTMPDPTRTDLQRALRTYVDDVLHYEWPLMRVGEQSSAAHSSAYVVISIVAHYQPTTPAQQSIQAQVIAMVDAFNDARRQRLFDNDQAIPPILWEFMVFIAIVTIGFCYLFRVRSHAVHFLMTIALTAVIGAVFVVIAEFDLPFRGYTQIPPTAFQRILVNTFGVAPSSLR